MKKIQNGVDGSEKMENYLGRCEDDLELFILVLSLMWNFKYREVIRKIWGNKNSFDVKIWLLFFMGILFLNEIF